MTTIACYNGMIASDSIYVCANAHSMCVREGPHKLYLNKFGTAVIAISGFVRDVKMLEWIEGALQQLQLDIENYPIVSADIKAMEKQVREMGFINDSLAAIVSTAKGSAKINLLNGKFKVSYVLPHEPVVLGTGAVSEVYSCNSAVEYVQTAMLHDKVTGGTIYVFDLAELENKGEPDVIG